MSARVLVVDDILANVRLLEVRLAAEYFEVMTATTGAEALKLCAEAEPDIIPSSPNELDPYQARQERPQQPAKPRLTVEQIKQAIANGATLSKDVLTLPDGARVKLKGPQIAAAREASAANRADWSKCSLHAEHEMGLRIDVEYRKHAGQTIVAG